MLATFSYVRFQRQNSAVGEDLEKLKQRLSLLDYLRQQNWTARPAAHGPEFVGLCPLHPETQHFVLCQRWQKSLLLSRLRPGRRSHSLCPVVPPSVFSPKPRLPRAAKRSSNRPYRRPRANCHFLSTATRTLHCVIFSNADWAILP